MLGVKHYFELDLMVIRILPHARPKSRYRGRRCAGRWAHLIGRFVPRELAGVYLGWGGWLGSPSQSIEGVLGHGRKPPWPESIPSERVWVLCSSQGWRTPNQGMLVGWTGGL